MNTGDANELSLPRDVTGLPDSAKRRVGNFSILFDKASFALALSNASNGVLVDVNEAWMKLFGFTKQEVIGKTTLDLNINPDAELRTRIFAQLQESGSAHNLEMTLLTKSGERRNFLTDVDEVEIDGQKYLLNTVQDITERKQAEDQLERSNQKLNEILSSIQDDFYVLDRDWKVVYANRLFTSKIGKEPEDFIGNNFWEMFPKHIGQLLEENFRAAMEKREIRRFEIPGQYTNAWYRMRVFPSAEGITVLGTDITERKRAEGQLRYQATLLSNVNDAIVASDYQFRLTGWNAAAEALYGWKAEEVIGRNGLEIAHTEWPEQDAEEMRQRIAEIGYWRGEATQARKDGSRFPVEISSFVLHDETGQITGYVSVNRDITERKRAEDQLRELSQRLTYHVDNSPLAVIEWGPDMRLIRWSTAAERMFGWKAKEVLGKRIEDFRWVYDEDTEQVKEVTTDLQTGIKSQRFSANRNYRKDGSVVYSEWYNSSLVDQAGNLRSILSLVLDVTDRRRAEQELMQSEERYRHLVKYAPTGMYEIDIKTMQFLEVNESMCQILGYTREELLSRTPGELLNEEGQQRFRERMLKMLAGEEVSPQTEYLVRAKDGHEIWGLLTTTINYDQGKPRSIAVVAHDITERKRAEEALRESEKRLQSLNESLEQKVHEKTAEVHGLASDLIKATQRERQRISHILHDDLQQRIYAIQMQLAFLRDGLPIGNELAASEVSDIEKELSDILKMTRDLSIDLSPPILRDEGLAHAIDWLANRVRQQYGLPIELQADGSFVIPNEELHVLVFSCVRELLFNVVKHAEASQAKVVLQWCDGDLRIEVRDDGLGFALSSPKQQMSGGTDVRTGLGLPTIRHQLGLFGGRVEIQSEPGAGTRVVLTVPVKDPVD